MNATQTIDIDRTPSFDPNNYVGRKALFETYEGEILEGTLELSVARAHSGQMIIRFANGTWANTGSTINFAD